MSSIDVELRQVAAIILTVRDVIEEAGKGGVPSGVLFASIQSAVGPRWTLSMHHQAVALLLEAGQVSMSNNVLTTVAKAKGAKR